MSPARALRWRPVRGDLRHDAAVNVALVVVVALSACLMGAGAMVMERLLSSVDRLFEVAQPPHFLQMHKGEVDLAALTRFADRHPEIESWFVEEMVGFDGAALAWERPATGASGDLGESLIDNLFVAQNETFDRLVDAADAAPVPEDGEVYVPVAYQESIGLQVGDLLTVATSSGPRTWEVRGFVRDAQMASSLSSATRFVVSESDLAALTAAGGGQPEVIVEYLLTGPGLASDLERAYAADPALPKNGQAVTYTMVRTLHAISDGLAAVALVLVAALLIAIALLVIRFVVRGRLEDDVRQIGAMRAIGIPARAIGRVYLTRYSLWPRWAAPSAVRWPCSPCRCSPEGSRRTTAPPLPAAGAPSCCWWRSPPWRSWSCSAVAGRSGWCGASRSSTPSCTAARWTDGRAGGAPVGRPDVPAGPASQERAAGRQHVEDRPLRGAVALGERQASPAGSR